MSPTRIQTTAVANFTCLGSACPDTCCQGWGMQVSIETIEKLTRDAPELLGAITSGEAEFVMKRDPVTDQCVKLDNGWCSIHRDYGEAFLGEACRFFPRVTRALGDTLVTSSTLACPETARLMLYTPDGLAATARSEVQVPYTLKNYLPAGLPVADALVIHQTFLDLAGEATCTAEQNMMRLSATARALEMQPFPAWGEALPFYLTMAAGRIPPAEMAAADPFNLLHALRGLAMAGKAPRARLLQVIDAMAQALGARFDPTTGAIALADDAELRAVTLLHHMRLQAPVLAPVLRRYLQAQLSQMLFPFAGFGHGLSDRVTILGVRLATVKLALATLAVDPAPDEVIRVIQTLARFTDHLADPALSMQIYHETGWVREARLRGLLNDA
ncbi:MAG: flagellin lysine-N-methylase [Pseudomonadota bacterium]